MLRYRLRLLVVPMLLLVLPGCSGSDGETSQDVQSDSTGETPDTITCPDGLVLWSEYNVCAPRVDECEAWEVPVIGGGCMAVGPRACPKLWDPDAEVDCEPGELMDYDGEPCPEGFVLTEDKVACVPFFEEAGVCGELEIPVLGGGCKKVGPDWSEGGEPYFDECGPWFLALPGGGCVMVGPRGCPKLWDPDADTDCKAGDVLACPEGTAESADGLSCEPIYDTCVPGERPRFGGGCGRVVPLPAGCPEGPFPAAPEGAGEVLHVLAGSPCTENCGAEAAPFPSIQAAVDAAPDGATVLVGPGVYDEGLGIGKPVHVIGLCAPLVELTGTVLVLSEEDSKVLEAGIGICDTAGVTLSGLHVRPEVAGVAVVGATGVELHGLEVAESHGVGLYIDQESGVSASALWIHDLEVGSGLLGDGIGVHVDGGSGLDADDVLVEAARKIGARGTGAGTVLALGDATIRDTLPGVGGEEGFGVIASGGAGVTLVSVLLSGNRSQAVRASGGGTTIDLHRCVLRETHPDPDGTNGLGLFVLDGSGGEATDTLIEANHGLGVLLIGEQSTLALVRTVVRDTQPDEEGAFGLGLQVAGGAAGACDGCLVRENRTGGVTVLGEGSSFAVRGSVVKDTQPDGTGAWGFGIEAGSGGAAVVDHSTIDGNTTGGISASGAGSHLSVDASAVRGTVADGFGKFGYGVQATGGARLDMARTLVEDNTVVGVQISGAGSSAALDRVVVRDTRPNAAGEKGHGISVESGAVAEVAGSALHGNRIVGADVVGEGSVLALSDSVLFENEADAAGQFGFGARALLGGVLEMERCAVRRNHNMGITLTHPWTSAQITDTVISDTQPDAEVGSGKALQVDFGAAVHLEGCLVDGNREVGVAIFGEETVGEIVDSEIRGTLPDVTGEIAIGVQAAEGATLLLDRSLVRTSASVGVNVADPGSEAMIRRSCIRATSATEQDTFGFGLDAWGGCRVTVSESLLEESTNLGVAIYGPDTEVSLARTVVSETRPNSEGAFGMGVQVKDAGALTMSGCLVEENTTGGVVIAGEHSEARLLHSLVRESQPNLDGINGYGVDVDFGAALDAERVAIRGSAIYGLGLFNGSTVRLSGSVVEDTRGGKVAYAEGGGDEDATFGDGVVSHGADLELDTSLLRANERCGAYFLAGAGAVEGSVVTGNASYGLAMEGSADTVAWEGTGSHYYGNGLELDEARRAWAQVTDNPGELPVPTPSFLLEAPGGR